MQILDHQQICRPSAVARPCQKRDKAGKAGGTVHPGHRDEDGRAGGSAGLRTNGLTGVGAVSHGTRFEALFDS